MRDKYLLRNYCIDYIPHKLLDKINLKNIMEWTDFMFYNKIFELKDIYLYLDNKLKDYESKTIATAKNK